MLEPARRLRPTIESGGYSVAHLEKRGHALLEQDCDAVLMADNRVNRPGPPAAMSVPDPGRNAGDSLEAVRVERKQAIVLIEESAAGLSLAKRCD